MNQLVYFNGVRDMQVYAKKYHLSLYAYKKAVYNLTDFIENHPYNELSIIKYENQDVTNILFNQSIFKHQSKVISALQHYLFGYIEKKEKTIVKFEIKSSKLIIEQTRKLLQESTEPVYGNIPDDCSIKEPPILRAHIIPHSQKSIQLTK